MKHFLLCTCLALALGGGVLAAGASEGSDAQRPSEQGKQTVNQSKVAPANSSQADRGEQVFTTNCVRCHTPPGGIPQRITGTVVMHMRVRARLSREDEQALLRFLAP